MRVHIDWLTFTLPMWYATREDATYEEAIEFAFVSTFTNEILAKAFGGQWERQERSRAPYTNAWSMKEAGVTLFASQSLNHCCIEISGSGCEKLIAADVMKAVIERVTERVTRIDVACDIETDVMPVDFVKQLAHERMRASGQQESSTGQTCYCGSQKSDRYARVYRYYAPHPRAHLLRIEHVFKKGYAKSVANAYLGADENAIANASGLAFGWAHPVWAPDSAQHADISIVSPDRNTGNTVHWLITSAAPAFRRLVASGKIRDAEAFLNEYFLSFDKDA